ncbi:MAG: hypothetical protein H6807_09145 [Planctomycetes bacterium]|nr:hypothetical protein [Planctomycetota bacterium]
MNRGRGETMVAALLVLIATIWLLWPPAGAPAGAVISANGVLDRHWPWRGPLASARESRWTLNDPALQMRPWRDFMRGEFEAGRLPFWNHLNGFGEPFLANPQTRCLYPPQWLYLLGADTSSAQSIFIGLHVLIGALGLLGLARRLGLGMAGSVLAAVGFLGFGFNPYWLLWPHHAVLAWLPLLLLLGDRLRARPRPGGFIAFALAFAMLLLAGHPETAFKAAVALAIFLGGRELEQRLRPAGVARGSWTGWLALPLSALAGGLLAAPQLLPFLEYLGDSQALAARAAGPAFPAHPSFGRFLGAIAGWGAQMFSPDFFGDGAGPGRFWYSEGNHNELATAYVGVLVLVLAPFGLRRGGGWSWALILTFGFAAAVVLRVPTFYDTVLLLPGFALGANNRFLAIVGLGLVLLAGSGLDRILAGDFDRPGFRRLRGLLLLLAFLAVSVLISLLAHPPEGEAARQLRQGIVLRAAALLAVALILLFLLLRWPARRGLVLAGLAALLAVDLGLHGRRALPWCARDAIWPRSPVIEVMMAEARPELGRLLAVEQAFGGPDSMAETRQRNFPAATNLAYGIANLDSYSALQPLAENRFDELGGFPVTANGKLALAWAAPGGFDEKLLDLAAVRWLLVPGDWSAQAGLVQGTEFKSADGRIYRQLHAGKDGLLLERSSALPRAFLVFAARAGDLGQLRAEDFDPRREALVAGEVPVLAPGEGRVRGLTLRPDLLEVEVEIDSGRALLVTSDLHVDGDRVEVNGEERRLQRCDGIFRGVVLEAGISRVRFRKAAAPRSFVLGLGLAGGVLVFFGLWAGRRLALRRCRSTS